MSFTTIVMVRAGGQDQAGGAATSADPTTIAAASLVMALAFLPGTPPSRARVRADLATQDLPRTLAEPDQT